MFDALAPKAPKSNKPLPGLHDAQVAEVLGGTVTVLLPFHDGGKYRYGPSPWPQGETSDADTHVHNLPAPSVGLWCAVMFADGDVAYPRVLAAYPDWEPDR